MCARSAGRLGAWLKRNKPRRAPLGPSRTGPGRAVRAALTQTAAAWRQLQPARAPLPQLPRSRPAAPRANGGPRAPPPPARDQTCFCLLQQQRRQRPSPPGFLPSPPPRPHFPSLFNHHPLILITANELQLIQPESCMRERERECGEGGRRGEGDGESEQAVEGGVTAGEGTINNAPRLTGNFDAAFYYKFSLRSAQAPPGVSLTLQVPSEKHQCLWCLPRSRTTWKKKTKKGR